jgi:hypothetical protein
VRQLSSQKVSLTAPTRYLLANHTTHKTRRILHQWRAEYYAGTTRYAAWLISVVIIFP